MKMNRSIPLTLVILLAVLAPLFAGGAPEAEGGRSAGPVVLDVWGGVPEENGPGELIAAFEAEHPDIKINYTRFVNDDEGNLRLDTALIAGGQVDVYFTYRADNLERRARSRNALSLDDLAAADGIDLAEEYGDLTYGTVDGSVYGIPGNRGPQFFMLNMDMFDAAGIEIPAEWTWAEFRQVARQLTSGSGQNKVYGVMYPTWAQLLMLGAMSELGPNGFLTSDMTEANFDDPLFADFARLRYEMQYNDGSEMRYVDIRSQNLSDATEFLGGRTAMLYTGTWRTRSVKDLDSFPHDFTVAFAPLPTNPGQRVSYNEGSPGDFAMIAGDTDAPEAAWEFIRYFTAEGIDPMVRLGGKIPAWTGYPVENVTEAMLGPDPEVLFDTESFERVVLEPVLRSYQATDPIARAVYNDMRNVLAEEMELYFIGQQNLQSTMRTVDERVTRLVEDAQ